MFADNILYVENPKTTPKKPVRTNKFSKVAGYKINIQTSVVFLYTINKLPEKENQLIYNIKNNKMFRNKTKL